MSIPAVLGIAGVLALGAMSPGASFLLIVRLSVTRSRAAGIAAALGMGLGCALFAVAALLGLQALFDSVPGLHRWLRIVGGGYLLVLAWRLWCSRDAGTPVAGADAPRDGGALLLGLLTQLSNPQTALVFASLFAAVLPAARQPGDYLVLPSLAFAIDALWFGLVACLLSAPAPRRLWARLRRPLDRLSALLMGGLGLRLICSTR